MGYRKPGHSDAFWDIEASKLQLVNPDLVSRIQYVSDYEVTNSWGVIESAFEILGFISKTRMRPHYRARINTFGPELYEACIRLRNSARRRKP